MTKVIRRCATVALLAAAIGLANVQPCLAFDWGAFGWVDGFKLSYSAFSSVIGEERWRMDTGISSEEHQMRLNDEKQKVAARRQQVREDKGEMFYFIAVALAFAVSVCTWALGLVCGFYAGLLSLFEWFVFRLLF